MIIRYEFDSEKPEDMDLHNTFSKAEKFALALVNLDLEIQRQKHSDKTWNYYDLRQGFARVMLDNGIDWDRDL